MKKYLNVKNKQCFFGYYDLQPFNSDSSKHLANVVDILDRIPNKDDKTSLGYFDLNTDEYHELAISNAWNFQQGSFLSWFNDDSIIFNDFDGSKYISRVVDLDKKEIKRYDLPIASISLDKTKALSINFSRIYDFRPGYGYCNIPDKYEDDAPNDDGIWYLDLKTGEYKLLVSYKKMKQEFAEEPFTSKKLVVNHITFNPSGTKYVFLLRNFYVKPARWGTVLGIGDLNGNIYKLTNFEVNSHYSFKDDNHLMIYSGLPEWGIYFFDIDTKQRTKLNNPECDKDDIHCNYSPDRSYFIGDGYPDENSHRHVYRYDFNTNKADELFNVYSLPAKPSDYRCDLHCRFNLSGDLISYDTTENKKREIVILDTKQFEI